MLVDLHSHTTASDGRCTPEALVRRAAEVGITTLGVTDHDTMAGVAGATAAAAREGIDLVPGIEITSVHGGKDVHVLGYFLNPETPGLSEMIADQRRRRIERAREIGQRLANMGAPIDTDELVATAMGQSGKAIARPQIAQALINAGHAATVAEAFERFLGEDCPAYVPHTGVGPAEVVQLILSGSGIASLAHPGYTRKDQIIPELVEAGMTAIEVYHCSHDEEAVSRYLEIARRYNLVRTGGSDYHGEGVRRAEFFGVTHLPAECYAEFRQRAGRPLAAHL